MFKLITKAVNWKAVTSSLFTLVEEAILVIKEDGIHCFVMDPSRVEAIGFFWPKESFTEYHLEEVEQELFNLNIRTLAAAFKRFGNDVEITVTVKDNQIVINGGGKRFACTNIVADEADNRTPKIPFDIEYEVNISKMEEMMDDCKVIGTHSIKIKQDDSNIVYEGTDSSGSVNGVMVEGFLGNCPPLGFNFTYMEPVLKNIKTYCDPKIKVEVYENAPMRLNFIIPDVLTIQYYLAPLVKQ